MSEAVVLVVGVGGAGGAKAAAAALACAGSGPDRAGLLIDLAPSRPRPSLIATVAARSLEERLVAHLPEAQVASRGQICHLAVPPGDGELAAVASALPLARGAVGVIHVPPPLLQPLLERADVRASAALLRADLREHRPLTGLLVRDLSARGIGAAVLKQPLGWVASRRALAGALPAGAGGGLPRRLRERLLGAVADAPGVTQLFD